MRSAESTLASSESKNNKSKVDQVWLSLSSSHPSLSLSLSPSLPKSYQCSLCSRRFRSVQALGGHQNAHRKERNAMHKMYMDLLRNVKQQQEQPPPVHSPSAHATSSLPNIPPVLVPDHDHRQPEIDLDLGLSCGPSPPKFKYYEFI